MARGAGLAARWLLQAKRPALGRTCRLSWLGCAAQRPATSSPPSPSSSSSQAKCSFGTPRTTYEGSSGAESMVPFGISGFSRATFVANKLRGRRELEDKYSMGEELGVGATAKVYRARSLRTGQMVALKAIDKELIPNDQMLKNEVGIHKATDHPNILRLLEIFEDDRYLYLVTELCEGGDLMRHLQVAGNEYTVPFMPEEDAVQLFEQVVASVRYLHMMGIVHRDLKPGNFLCAASQKQSSSSLPRVIMKLTDFGVSASCGIKHLLTRRVGTDGYMAPEVLTCKPYNEKADVFSIGCILHTMLTGNPPKRKDDGSYKIDKLRLRYVSDELRQLVEWLTQPLPKDRPSIEELAKSPVLLRRQKELRKSAARMDTSLLDHMHAYSSYPLLKKAALVAMVSRAESDADFLPLIEKFMSFGSHMSMNYAIGCDDLYKALKNEMLTDIQSVVMSVLRGAGERRGHFRGRRRPATERFQKEMYAQVSELIRKIDCAGSGQVSYSEWLAATIEPEWYSDEQRIEATFRLFDWDADGMISEADLKQVIPEVFAEVEVDAVLAESQLSAVQTSWISREQFSLLMRTRNLSSFTLRRLADGVEDPLLSTNCSSVDM